MLVHTVMPLDDPEQNLNELWHHVKRLYKEMDVLLQIQFPEDDNVQRERCKFSFLESSGYYSLRILCGSLSSSLMIIPGLFEYWSLQSNAALDSYVGS